MIRLLIRLAVFVGSSAIGLVVATMVLDDMTLDVQGFLLAVAVFSVAQALLSPFVSRVAERNAEVLLGGAGLISTLLALIVTSLLTSGLTIDGGIGTWLAAMVIVWAATAVATLFLPYLVLRARRRSRTNDQERAGERGARAALDDLASRDNKS
ncbi:phage holin family protein [Nocardioides bruguierae]|uniref:Phage holin family protein n=1 Tax=Nocardioides bruguierae TaxID=2945102 RepID=A0A9X2DB07_9ACTN|nr:phage holin family protein [Nocardioides bruguierae]MCL8027146.1 phage holin family protein [Nocardioides bruguierae]MCM0622294.1 phage holin family protein [Nocardioides bruguierae]